MHVGMLIAKTGPHTGRSLGLYVIEPAIKDRCSANDDRPAITSANQNVLHRSSNLLPVSNRHQAVQGLPEDDVWSASQPRGLSRGGPTAVLHNVCNQVSF